MSAVLLAAVAANCGVTVALLVPAPGASLLRSRLPPAGAAGPAGADTGEAPRARSWWRRPQLAVVGVAAGVAAAAFRPAPTVVPLAVSAVVVVATGVALLRRSRARGRAHRRRSAVIEACDALAAGLRAGQSPPRVLSRVSSDVPLLASAATASRLGGDVPLALRVAAASDGAEGLRLVSAAWTVAQRSGAGLADVVARIAGTVRADTAQRRQVEVALGTSRSTARLLAGLPLLGLLLGSGLDAQPLDVLLGTPAGAWCLCAGTALAAAGLLWVERLADGALR